MNNRSLPIAIALFGPTAAGKTQIALEIAKKYNAAIISLDSVQIYRGMNIGSAKPTPEELSQAPHYLIDIADPDQPMNTFEISRLAVDLGLKLTAQGKIPLFCGGTGLYFKALFQGMFEGPSQCPEIRKRLNREALEQGLDTLYQRFFQIDPEAASKVSPNDYIRIERGLEVFEMTGRKISELRKEYVYQPPFCFVKLAIAYPREELYRRIEQRVEEMLVLGLVDEVRKLYHRYPNAYPIQASIGYKEVIAYLQGHLSYEAMVALLKQDTRRFAKRQFTLFNHLDGVQWFVPPALKPILEYIAVQIG